MPGRVRSSHGCVGSRVCTHAVGWAGLLGVGWAGISDRSGIRTVRYCELLCADGSTCGHASWLGGSSSSLRASMSFFKRGVSSWIDAASVVGGVDATGAAAAA